jgi:hypothetical protein
MVFWNDVQDFIKKLNEKESGNKYRLPTEAVGWFHLIFHSNDILKFNKDNSAYPNVRG